MATDNIRNVCSPSYAYCTFWLRLKNSDPKARTRAHNTHAVLIICYQIVEFRLVVLVSMYVGVQQYHGFETFITQLNFSDELFIFSHRLAF